LIAATPVQELIGKTRLEQLQFRKACFCLGAAAHLVQDLCVPHHSRSIVYGGHQRYETWVEKHVEHYLVWSKGIYDDTMVKARDWVIANVRVGV